MASGKGSTHAINRQEVTLLQPLRPFFSAWRTVQTGGREFVEALVAPPETIDQEALSRALAEWPGAWYWRDAGGRRLVLVRPLVPDAPPRWWLHILLLAMTVLCTLGAGAALAGAWYPWNGAGLLGVVEGIGLFVVGLIQGDWRYILDGWTFAIPLLGILLVHELGHFLAARRYAIRASPPYFLPIPPTLSPIGSLGAFLSVRSPVLDRRQLLDVGAAGPLAGFVVVLVVLIWGLLLSERGPFPVEGVANFIPFAGHPIRLGDSLLTRWLGEWLVPGSGPIRLSLPAFAGWVGAFITALNLLPLSQLDGGHVLYGLLGRRQGIVAVVAVAGLLVLAQFSWSWYIWVVLTFIVGRGRWSHPSVLAPSHAVPVSRQWIGWICMVVLLVTLVPVPFGR